jgi:hypothetical protein
MLHSALDSPINLSFRNGSLSRLDFTGDLFLSATYSRLKVKVDFNRPSIGSPKTTFAPARRFAVS